MRMCGEIIRFLARVAAKAANQRRCEEERRTVKKKKKKEKMRKEERVDLYTGRPGGGVKGQ